MPWPTWSFLTRNGAGYCQEHHASCFLRANQQVRPGMLQMQAACGAAVSPTTLLSEENSSIVSWNSVIEYNVRGCENVSRPARACKGLFVTDPLGWETEDGTELASER